MFTINAVMIITDGTQKSIIKQQLLETLDILLKQDLI